MKNNLPNLNAPLAGLKIVELAGVLAGPAVGMFLAELGATVIKIENKVTQGDMTRHWKLPSEDPQWPFSAYYCSVNWGKTALLLDLTLAEDLQQALAYIAEADVVISNFKITSAQKMGLDPETLRKKHPRLIFALITGYADGDDRPAFDVVLQAEAGFLYMTGEPGGKPVKMPVALIDLLAAHQLKEGILLALLHRERTGEGLLVQVSLFAAAVAALANQATNWLIGGHIPQPMGTLHPNIAPYGEIFTTLDGLQIVLAVGVDRQFEQLCKVLGHQEWSTSPQYRHNVDRLHHRDQLFEELQAEIGKHTRQFLLDEFQKQGVPAGAVYNMAEVFAQPEAADMVMEWHLPDGTAVKSVRSAVFELKQ